MSLFSSVIFSSDIPEDIRRRLNTAIGAAIGDRNETEVTVNDYILTDDVASFSLSYQGKTVPVETPLEYLEDEINAVFYYDESLFEDGERLDYIYRSSFSSVTLGGAGRGQNYALIGESGRTEALFVVDSVYENAVTLKPYFIRSPLPGMKMKRINGFSISLRTFSSFSFNKIGGSVSLYHSGILYPLSPFLSLAVIYDGKMTYHLDAGASASFAFASVWPSVPVVKNLSIEGEFALGISFSGKSALSSEYSVLLKWMMSRVFSLSVGVTGYSGENYIALTMGGKL